MAKDRENPGADVDVLIVGAGPAGLVLAVELARRGVCLRIVDKAAEFFGGSRADGLTPRTQEVFEDLGIMEEILAGGDLGALTRIYKGESLVWEGRMSEPIHPTPDVPHPNIWFVPQYRTELILRERLAALGGGKIEMRNEFVALEQNEDGVSATLSRDGARERVRARYLVGADGGRSTVRAKLGIGFPGETDESTCALFADARIEGLDRSHGRVWLTDAVPFAVIPLSGTDLFTISAQPQPANREDTTLNYVRRKLAEASGRSNIQVKELTWSTVWRANIRLAEEFRNHRVFLIGDAAHVFHPTGGQGMNTGIQDAYNLGWKLAAVLDGAPIRLLDSYETERRPAAATALALSARLLAKHQRGEADAHRRGVEVQQLGLNYRGGPLAAELRLHSPRVQAGDRAPDAPLKGADGQSLRVFSLLKGTHWTLVGYQVESNKIPRARKRLHIHTFSDRGDLVDHQGQFLKSYNVGGGEWVLIRPDGYIGAIASTENLPSLEQYLNSVGLGG